MKIAYRTKVKTTRYFDEHGNVVKTEEVTIKTETQFVEELKEKEYMKDKKQIYVVDGKYYTSINKLATIYFKVTTSALLKYFKRNYKDFTLATSLEYRGKIIDIIEGF